MPNHKRTIPVSEVKPGDSIGLGGSFVLFVTRVLPNAHDEYGDTRIYARGPSGRLYAERFDQGSTVTVGYTNRKAKRARGKMARRARKSLGIKASRIRGASHTFTWADEAGSWPTDAQV